MTDFSKLTSFELSDITFNYFKENNLEYTLSNFIVFINNVFGLKDIDYNNADDIPDYVIDMAMYLEIKDFLPFDKNLSDYIVKLADAHSEYLTYNEKLADIGVLPLELFEEVLKNRVIKSCHYLSKTSFLFSFDIDVYDLGAKTTPDVVHFVLKSLPHAIRRKYLSYKSIDSISIDNDRTKLPLFYTLVKFIGHICYYYREVYLEYEEIRKINNDSDNINHSDKNFSFITNYNKLQLENLYNLLIVNEYISNKTELDSFLFVFGGNSNIINFVPLIWIDKSKTRKELNIQTLFYLLTLLKIDQDTSTANKFNLYCKMKYCFEGLKHISSKNPHKNFRYTDRHILLKTIVESIQ